MIKKKKNDLMMEDYLTSNWKHWVVLGSDLEQDAKDDNNIITITLFQKGKTLRHQF